ncbi:hypothetical protein POM88_038290 [Heracleum sosnowskyi]|uniref:Uncharacterized protein n=1 Tax=Heracleum sosnowskyi TaxID=360622 RepID=A0AAD8HAE4_9APIA|nr:hypothetical protein POM88_038290 [Heracleum sosnowskyi]
MKQTGCCGCTTTITTFLHSPPPNLNFHLPAKQLGCRWRRVGLISVSIHKRHSTTVTAASYSSSDKPYFDYPVEEEEDIITFLHPPKHLIPLDPSSFNPALYLCKKIGDIPEERRHRLLSLLNPSLISRAWEVAGTKYDDPKLAKKTASNILRDYDGNDGLIEFWNCRSSGGGSVLARFSYYFPMYFMVKQVNEVMSTEQPCDMAYEFGDGVWDHYDYPQGFPKPAKHPWPFNDEVVVYIRQIGPGVLVGQAWQEGEAVEQVPKKLCGEILMVKDYGRVSK